MFLICNKLFQWQIIRDPNSLWENFENQSKFDFRSTTSRFHATYSLNWSKTCNELNIQYSLQIGLLIKITSFAKNRMNFAGKKGTVVAGLIPMPENKKKIRMFFIKSNWTHPIIIIQWSVITYCCLFDQHSDLIYPFFSFLLFCVIFNTM